MYLFFSSGMECRNLSHRCSRLYFPMFLFREDCSLFIYGFFDGSGHIASFSAYDLEVFVRCFVASVVLVLKIGDGAFKCTLYLSTKVLDDSHIYSSSQSILSH